MRRIETGIFYIKILLKHNAAQRGGYRLSRSMFECKYHVGKEPRVDSCWLLEYSESNGIFEFQVFLLLPLRYIFMAFTTMARIKKVYGGIAVIIKARVSGSRFSCVLLETLLLCSFSFGLR